MTYESTIYEPVPNAGFGSSVLRAPSGRFVSTDPLNQPRKLIEGALRRAAMRSPQSLDNACNRLLESAANGETWQERISAFKEIADRLDGKAVARIETSEGAPRDLSLADIVSAVLSARKNDAVPGDTIITSDHDSTVVTITNDASTRNDQAES